MRQIVMALFVVVFASPAFAQTQVVGTENLGWDQPAPTLTAAQGYIYLAADGTAAPQPLSGVTCAGTASPFLCQVRLPALTTGLHALTLQARTVVNGQTLTSGTSAPLSVLIVAVPAIPQNPRIINTP